MHGNSFRLKRILSVLLVIAVCMALMPTAALAEEGTLTDGGVEYVSGGYVTGETLPKKMYGSGAVTVPTWFETDGGGIVYFMPASGTEPAKLILENAELNGSSTVSVYDLAENTVLELRGSSTADALVFENVKLTGSGCLKGVIAMTGEMARENFTGTLNGFVDKVSIADLKDVTTVEGDAVLRWDMKISSQGPIKNSMVIPQGASLTIWGGVSLTLSGTDVIDNQGKLVNNGTIIVSLLADQSVESVFSVLKPEGTGIILIKSGTDLVGAYNNSGVELKYINGDLDLSDASAEQGSLETDGYHWEWNTESKTGTLTLKNIFASGKVVLPYDYYQLETVNLVTEGDSILRKIVNYNVDFEEGSFLSVKSLNFQGTAPLTIQEPICISESAAATVYESAVLNALKGIRTNASGGVGLELVVNGMLTAGDDVDSNYAAITCAKVSIGPAGVLEVSGQKGVRVRGVMNLNEYKFDFSNAFEIADGGKFIGKALNCNIMVFTESEDVSNADLESMIVLPDGYMPDGFIMKVIRNAENPDSFGQEKFAAVIAPDDNQNRILLGDEYVDPPCGPFILEKPASGNPDGENPDGENPDGEKPDGGDTSIVLIQYPTIICDAGAEWSLNVLGTDLTITVKEKEGYELKDVTLNGDSQGKVTGLSGLKTGDIVVITTQKPAEETVEPENPSEEPEDPGLSPEEPDDSPAEPDDSGISPDDSSAETEVPKTGDHNNLFLWAALLLLGAFGTMFYSRRKCAK